MSGGEERNGEAAHHREPAAKGFDDGSPSGRVLTIRVLLGSSHRHLTVPAETTFGDLKKLLCREAGLEPQEHRLLFRGRDKDEDERLGAAGVKNLSKLVLVEDPVSKERKQEEMRSSVLNHRACEAVSLVRAEVEKLSQKVSDLSNCVRGGKKVEEKEFLILTELLMLQLLKLDGIEAEGEAKAQRKIEVRKIQSYVEALDTLKAINSSPVNGGHASAAVGATTHWETFDSGPGSAAAPPMPPASTMTASNDWELFD